MSPPQSFLLPDLASGPLKDAIDPYYKEVSRASERANFFFRSIFFFFAGEVSDDQNRMDAHRTGKVLVNAMKHSEWNGGSKIARITKE